MKFYLKIARINRILRIRPRKTRVGDPNRTDRFHLQVIFFKKTITVA